MKTPARLTAITLLTATLAACSGGNTSNDPLDDPGTSTNAGGTSGSTDSATTGSTTGSTGSGTTGGGTTDTGTDGSTTGAGSTDADTDSSATDSGTTTGTDTDGSATDSGATDSDTDGSATDAGSTDSDTDGSATDAGSTDSDTDGSATDAGSTDSDTDGSGTDGSDTDGGSDGAGIPPLSDGEVPPELPDPFADAVPSPDASDPYGSLLEVDDEEPTGEAPTAPKNLRIDLVSNDWAEFNWAPSNDNGEVVAYNIYRSDGHIYTVGRDQTDPVGGTQDEINKIWQTTSFIDCNYTRFLDRLHVCQDNGPTPGNTYSYQVTAVDDDGNESDRSNSITITYHAPLNAPIPRYDDFYLDPSDRFAQRNNFSQTEWFLNEFEIMFEDNFNGDEIDSTKWNTELVWADNSIINGEQQYFVDTQEDPDFGYNPFNLTGSSLVIEAVPVPDELRENLPEVCDEADPFGVDRCEFLSGALSSHDKYGFIYGYVEGRMRVSGGAGALSSFYLYHRYAGNNDDLPLLHAPEIDIVEYLGENPFGDEDAFQTHHFDDVTTGQTRSAPTMSYKNPDGSLYSEGYHTYGVLWEPQLVIWYIDGVEIKRMTGPQVGRQPMNIVTYLVAGSGWAPTPDINDPDLFPLRYEIDYIRAYQRNAYQSTSSYGN